MENNKIIEILRKISFLLEVKGESPFKSNAYNTAADIIETQNLDVKHLVKEGKLSEINGFGKALVEKISDYVVNGNMSYYAKLIKDVPESLLELKQIDGLGSKKIHRLWQELGVTDISSLLQAANDNKISELKGFGSKTQKNILEQING